MVVTLILRADDAEWPYHFISHKVSLLSQPMPLLLANMAPLQRPILQVANCKTTQRRRGLHIPSGATTKPKPTSNFRRPLSHAERGDSATNGSCRVIMHAATGLTFFQKTIPRPRQPWECSTNLVVYVGILPWDGAWHG